MERLAALEIRTVLDLLQHYPRRYVDRTRQVPLGQLEIGSEATVFGVVRRVSSRRTRGGRSMAEVVIGDGLGYLHLTFFNQPWRTKQLATGSEIAVFGKVDAHRGTLRMTNPAVDVLGRPEAGSDAQRPSRTGVILPVYPMSGKADLSSAQISKFVDEALRRAGEFADPVAAATLAERSLIDRTSAYRAIHQPGSMGEVTSATKRLIFDEFLRMQVGLVARKRSIEMSQRGVTHTVDGALVRAFFASLPYSLTGDQTRVVEEIARDLGRVVPMHRLVQGDVGSGKTVVALSALLMAVQGGHQGALMAPTEVLAEQHWIGLSRLVDGLHVPDPATLAGDRPVRVELLSNRTTAAQRQRLVTDLARGGVDIVVGTHALLYGELPFQSLGLVVIDEQHRFGVEQRALLRGRGDDPDVLVMTATPIPRTAAMLVYGDLDISELREMPPGRTPISTSVIDPDADEPAWEKLREQVGSGRQAYVVCPLVEGTPRVEARSAVEEFERLSGGELAGLRLGLLHGQMSPADKDAAMESFRRGDTDVLVSTTVIEVGVDVPNATVMVILDANRFGLSQLHQLRGRVGRGGGESWCFLVATATTPDAQARLDAMAASSDGFALAERDLEIRGAGEVFGERQAGFSDLKLGRIPRDAPVVMAARAVAERVLDSDPHLERNRQLVEEVEDVLGSDVDFLFKS